MGSPARPSNGTEDSAARLEDAKESLASLVCRCDFPPHSFAGPDAKRLFQHMHTSDELGDFDSIKAGCLKFYERDAIRIKNALANANAKMNLSVETFVDGMWDHYVCLTAHFLDENFIHRNWVLMLKRFYCDTLAEDIWKCLEHFGISGKAASLALKSFCLDDETVKHVKDLMQERSQVLVGGKLFYVQCCAQLLTSMAQKAVNEVTFDIIHKLQMLYSWGRSEPLWRITHHKLKQSLRMLANGGYDDLDPYYQKYLLSAEEWEKVEGVTKLVDMVDAVTEALFHISHPSASLYLANLLVLRSCLTEHECSSFANPIREKMLKQLKKYWENMFPALAVAAVMDPRCKMAYIEYLCTKVPPSNGEVSTQSSAVLEIVRSLYDSYLSSTPPQLKASKSDDREGGHFSSEDEIMEIDEDEEKVAEKEGSENCVNASVIVLLQEYQECVHVQASDKQPTGSELEMYLEEPVVAWDEDFKLVKWWKRESQKYPVLSRMARDLLAIPFMVTTSYDGYDSEDRDVDTRMLSSEPDLINSLSCTRSWNR